MTKNEFRNSKLYKNLDSFNATWLIEWFVEADNEQDRIIALQYLHDTGIAYKLQGFFWRMCQWAIQQWIILE